MSINYKYHKRYTIHVVSILIIFIMFVLSIFFTVYADDKNHMIDKIWNHIEELTWIVIGYLFGSNHTDSN